MKRRTPCTEVNKVVSVKDTVTVHILILQVTRLDGTANLRSGQVTFQCEFACLLVLVEVVVGIESQAVITADGIDSMSLNAEVVPFNNLVILLVLGLDIRADNSQGGMYLTQLLLGCHTKVNTLTVPDVVVDGRLEGAAVDTT